MTRRLIEGNYARLLGIKDAALTSFDYLPRDIGADYQLILESLRSGVDDDFVGFDLTNSCFFDESSNEMTFQTKPLHSKLNQLIRYLEMIHRASSRIVEIGSVYNLIRDEELKSRCSDLLSATDHFDRVINQATQVLEERIRSKVPQFSSDIGTGLVNKAIKAEPTVSPLKFSQNPSEQDGYASIMRGLVGAFRNPSHHRFIENVSREQALQICAFIDNMLAALDSAETQSVG